MSGSQRRSCRIGGRNPEWGNPSSQGPDSGTSVFQGKPLGRRTIGRGNHYPSPTSENGEAIYLDGFTQMT
jgi:hypothetical protein